jgi:hypothetical protein
MPNIFWFTVCFAAVVCTERPDKLTGVDFSLIGPQIIKLQLFEISGRLRGRLNVYESVFDSAYDFKHDLNSNQMWIQFFI